MSQFDRSLQLLWTRRFGTFWVASLLSNIGTWAQMVAQPWLMLNLGASSFLLGLDAFAMGAPVVLLTVVGGLLADRADRRRVIARFQLAQMLCPTLIVVLIVTGLVRPWMIIVLSLIVGVTDALSMPSFQSIVPSIVTREQLGAGIALNALQFNLSRILGPAIAGVLMVSAGAAGAFAVSAASYVPLVLVALWILPRGADPDGADPLRFDRHELPALLRRIAAQPLLRDGLLQVLIGSLLCAQVMTFAPVLIQQSFRGSVAHFSLVAGAFGGGGLLGAALLLGVDPDRDRRPLAAGLGVAFALVVLLVAAAPVFWALPLLFAAAGVAMTAGNASANTALLRAAPVALRGQTVSLYMLAMRGGSAVGALLTGAVVTLWGVRVALCLNGALALALQLRLARTWLRAAPAG